MLTLADGTSFILKDFFFDFFGVIIDRTAVGLDRNGVCVTRSKGPHGGIEPAADTAFVHVASALPTELPGHHRASTLLNQVFDTVWSEKHLSSYHLQLLRVT